MRLVKPGLTNRFLRPVLVGEWVSHDFGVLDGLQLGEGFAVPLSMAPLLEQRVEVAVAVVDGGEAVHQLADGLGEVLVGGVGVGPQGVAAGGRDHDGVEDRAERRALHERDVGVPALAVPVLLGRDLLVELAGLRVVDLEDLLVFLEPGDDGVGDRGLAEECGECGVLLGVQVGAREEDDLVVEEGLADGRHRLGVEGPVEVEVAYLGADGPRERGDVELERSGRGHGWRASWGAAERECAGILTNPRLFVK